MPQSPKSNRHGKGQPTRGNSGMQPKKNPDAMPANVCRSCSYYAPDHSPDCPRNRAKKEIDKNKNKGKK